MKRFALPILLLAAVLGGCGNDDDEVASAACTELTTDRLALAGLTIERATEVAASDTLPAHCRIGGTLDPRTGIDGKPYAIGFELRLPLSDAWNGKFFFQGTDGTGGVIAPATGALRNAASGTALKRGYAVASSDGGHATGASDVSFGRDPQARIDYGYNAVGRIADVARQILQVRYGQAPAHSYLVGCGNGGRDAMVAAARFADRFDGLVAEAPGLNSPKAGIAQQWDTQQFMSAAGAGQLPKDAFPAATLRVVADAILAQCDALDGVADGIVNDRVGCQSVFNLAAAVPTCSTGASGCLSAAQKSALQKVFAGAKNGAGQSLYATWPWDAGIAGADWRFWKLDAGFAPLPNNTVAGAGAMGFVFTSPPDAPSLADIGLAYQLAFDMDADAPKIFATAAPFTQSAMSFMTPPDPTHLTTLKNRGGKLLVVHGTADPVYSANDSIAWYSALSAADADAAGYARLMLVPGMNHCAGGPTTDRFDLLAALEDWVEKGIAPDTITATVNPSDPDVIAAGWPATRSRPLCAYPKQAVVKSGATGTEDASSFQCQ